MFSENKSNIEEITLIRQLAISALFGSLWGIFEMSAGALLTLSRIPLTGSVLTIVGISILATARYFSPLPGTCLMVGFTCAALRFLSIGGSLLGPALGVAITTVVMELVTTAYSSSKKNLQFAGGLSASLMPVQGFVYTVVAMGYTNAHNVYKAFVYPVYMLLELAHIKKPFFIEGHTLFLFWVFLHYLAGYFAVKTALKIAGQSQKRLSDMENHYNHAG